MSRWKEQFQNHPIHATLQEICSLIDIERQDMTHDEQVEKRRFRKVILAYQEVLLQLDPELIPYQLLGNLNSNLQQNILNQLISYKSQPNANYLQNANDQITNLLENLGQLSVMTKKVVSEKPLLGLEKSVDEFSSALNIKKEQLQNELNKISTTVDEYEQQIKDFSNTINTKKQETDTLIAEWQKQFSYAQDTRSNDFIKAQKDIKSNYEGWQEKIKIEADSKVHDIVSKTKETLEQHQKGYDDTVSRYLSSATEKHQAILELYEIVAGDSVAAGYFKNAEDEKSQANFWRWVSIIFIAFTAIWTALTYLLSILFPTEGGILWAQILKTFSVTAVLLFGAVYSAKQSNIHRQNEKRTRWFALEVKAIDPFISSLDDNERKSLKKILSKRLFAQNNHSQQDTDHKVIDEHAFSILIKGIVDILKVR
jgi:hypothetical protein